MAFNLADYEQVEDRIKRFYTIHPDGTIETEIIEHTKEYVVMKATLRVAAIAVATGFAQEFRSFEKEKSGSGKEYEPVNMFNYIENCETSAIGRALANFNFSGSKRPSRSEMEKVERHTSTRPTEFISEAQRKLVFARLRAKGFDTKESQKEILQNLCGVESSADIKKAQMDKLLKDLDALNEATPV